MPLRKVYRYDNAPEGPYKEVIRRKTLENPGTSTDNWLLVLERDEKTKKLQNISLEKKMHGLLSAPMLAVNSVPGAIAGVTAGAAASPFVTPVGGMAVGMGTGATVQGIQDWAIEKILPGVAREIDIARKSRPILSTVAEAAGGLAPQRQILGTLGKVAANRVANQGIRGLSGAIGEAAARQGTTVGRAIGEMGLGGAVGAGIETAMQMYANRSIDLGELDKERIFGQFLGNAALGGGGLRDFARRGADKFSRGKYSQKYPSIDPIDAPVDNGEAVPDLTNDPFANVRNYIKAHEEIKAAGEAANRDPAVLENIMTRNNLKGQPYDPAKAEGLKTQLAEIEKKIAEKKKKAEEKRLKEEKEAAEVKAQEEALRSGTITVADRATRLAGDSGFKKWLKDKGLLVGQQRLVDIWDDYAKLHPDKAANLMRQFEGEILAKQANKPLKGKGVGIASREGDIAGTESLTGDVDLAAGKVTLPDGSEVIPGIGGELTLKGTEPTRVEGEVINPIVPKVEPVVESTKPATVTKPNKAVLQTKEEIEAAVAARKLATGEEHLQEFLGIKQYRRSKTGKRENITEEMRLALENPEILAKYPTQFKPTEAEQLRLQAEADQELNKLAKQNDIQPSDLPGITPAVLKLATNYNDAMMIYRRELNYAAKKIKGDKLIPVEDIQDTVDAANRSKTGVRDGDTTGEGPEEHGLAETGADEGPSADTIMDAKDAWEAGWKSQGRSGVRWTDEEAAAHVQQALDQGIPEEKMYDFMEFLGRVNAKKAIGIPLTAEETAMLGGSPVGGKPMEAPKVEPPKAIEASKSAEIPLAPTAPAAKTPNKVVEVRLIDPKTGKVTVRKGKELERLADGTVRIRTGAGKNVTEHIVKPEQIVGSSGMLTTAEAPKTSSVELDELKSLLPAKVTSEEIELGMNKKQLIHLLGPKMYDKPITEVTIKELTQNALDASRAAGTDASNPKKIKITTDEDERRITVEDLGPGMNADIVKKAFFTLGGTHKTTDPANTSGGLGLAKMAFMLGSKKIRLETTREGNTISVEATAEQISEGKFNLNEEFTGKPSGTKVDVYIPENYRNTEGEIVDINFLWGTPDFLQKPLLAPVEVEYNGEILPIGIHTKNYQKDNLFKFSWGDIVMHINPEKTEYPNIYVLSAGLHQFEPYASNIYGYDNPVIPHNIVLDVRPKVRTDNPAYPFNNQREGWRGTIKSDIDMMYKFLQKQAVFQELQEAQESFKTIKQLPKIADISSGISETDVDNLANRYQGRETKNYELPKYDSVDFSGEKILLTSSKGTTAVDKNEYVKPSMSSEKKLDPKDIELDTSTFDNTTPQFHNNTSAEFPEAVKMFTELGNIMQKVVRTFGQKVSRYADIASEEPTGWFVGISLDKSYRGLNMVKPFKAIWTNPLTLSKEGSSTPAAAASEYFHTIIHEITHQQVRSEDGRFTAELANNYGRLRANDIPVEYFERILADTFDRNWKQFNQARAKFNDYNTKNRARSFEQSSLGVESGGETSSNTGSAASIGNKTEYDEGSIPSRVERTSSGNIASDKIGDLIASGGSKTETPKFYSDPFLLHQTPKLYNLLVKPEQIVGGGTTLTSDPFGLNVMYQGLKPIGRAVQKLLQTAADELSPFLNSMAVNVMKPSVMRVALGNDGMYDGKQLADKVISMSSAVERKLYLDAGIYGKFKGKVKPEEASKWLSENGLQAETVSYGQKNVSPREGIPTATPFYNSISPADTDKYPVVRVDVVIPQPKNVKLTPEQERYKKIQEREGFTDDEMQGYLEEHPNVKAKSPAIWPPDNIHENLPNTLAWAAGQYRTLPDGRKVLNLYEIQSRWAQERRANEPLDIEPVRVEGKTQMWKLKLRDPKDEKFMGTPRGFSKEEAMLQAKDIWKQYYSDHPLLKEANRLAIKAAIDRAVKDGADGIVISDAESAMMTEMHDQQGGTPTQEGGMRFNYDPDYMIVGKDGELLTPNRFPTVEDAEAFANNATSGLGLKPQSKYPKDWKGPKDEADYKVVRGDLHEIAKDITKDAGVKVSLGEHKNAFNKNDRQADNGDVIGYSQGTPRENLIFKNPDGSFKTDNSGVYYDLSTVKAKLAETPFSPINRGPVGEELYSDPFFLHQIPKLYNLLVKPGIKAVGRGANAVFNHLTPKGEEEKFVAQHPNEGGPVQQAHLGYRQELVRLNNRFDAPMDSAIRELRPTESEINKVTKHLDMLNDFNGISTYQLTNREQRLANVMRQVIQDSASPDLDAPWVNNSRPKQLSPHYSIDSIMDAKVRKTVNAGGENAKKWYDVYYDWYQRQTGDSDRAESDKMLNLVLGKSKDRFLVGSPSYAAVRRAEGIGLPPQMRERNGVARIYYNNARTAADIAYHHNVEMNPVVGRIFGHINDGKGNNYYKNGKDIDLNDPAEVAKFTPTGFGSKTPVEVLTNNPELQSIRDEMLLPRMATSDMVEKLTAVVNSARLGPWSAVRDVGSSLGPTMRYMEGFADYADFGRGLIKYLSGGSEAVLRGNVRAKRSGDYQTNFDVARDGWNKISDILRTVQGRDQLEKAVRSVLGDFGRLLAENRMAQEIAGQGDFLDNMVGKNWRTMPREKVLDLASQAFMEQVQGNYTSTYLPKWLLKSNDKNFLRGIFNLQRWSLERARRFRKEAIEPMVKNGDIKPLLKETVGYAIGATGINALAEWLFDRKPQEMTWSEFMGLAKDSSIPTEKKLDELTYTLANKFSLMGMGGMYGTILNNLMKIRHGEQMFPIENPMMSLIGDTSMKVVNAINGMGLPGQDVNPIEWFATLGWEVLADEVQGVRMMRNAVKTSDKDAPGYREEAMFNRVMGETKPALKFAKDSDPFSPVRKLKNAKTEDEVLSTVGDLYNYYRRTKPERESSIENPFANEERKLQQYNFLSTIGQNAQRAYEADLAKARLRTVKQAVARQAFETAVQQP